MIEKITVKTKKQTIELDYEEAKELFNALGDIFGKKDYYYPCTTDPLPPIYPIVTCGCSTEYMFFPKVME